MSKKYSASSDKSASAYTASIGIQAQVGSDITQDGSTISSGISKYLPGVRGKVLTVSNFFRGLNAAQFAEVSAIIQRFLKDLAADTSIVSGNAAALNALRLAAINKIIAATGLVDAGGIILTLLNQAIANGTAGFSIVRNLAIRDQAIALVPVDTTTQVPLVQPQMAISGIAVDDAISGTGANTSVYVSDEGKAMIRRIVPASITGLGYPNVQTIAKFQSGVTPTGMYFDDVSKLVYASLSTSNSFFVYSNKTSTGYTVPGQKTLATFANVLGGTVNRVDLRVLGSDNVGKMYYMQYDSTNSVSNSSYIYRYDPVLNTHTLVTKTTPTISDILQGSSSALAASPLSNYCFFSGNITFASDYAYSYLIPNTIIKIRLGTSAPTLNSIDSTSTVQVIKSTGVGLSASGGSNIPSIAAYRTTTGGTKYSLYYSFTGSNSIYRTFETGTADFSAPTIVFNTAGTSGFSNGASGGVGATGSAGTSKGNFNYNSSNLLCMDFDSFGNMYFGDYSNYVVRKITNTTGGIIDPTTSVVSWVAGNVGNGEYNGDTSSYNAAT